MVKKIFTLTSMVVINTSLFAIDLEQSVNIISQAKKATVGLQDEFDLLLKEKISTPEDILVESNLTATKKSTCNEEQNISLAPKEVNIPLESNNSIVDNGCTNTEIQGNSMRGLIIFKTRIKPFCKMNGEEFSKQYMQEDWDDIYHEKEFKAEVFKACPKIEKRYKDKWTPHLYQFSLEYASDSDAIPEC